MVLLVWGVPDLQVVLLGNWLLLWVVWLLRLLVVLGFGLLFGVFTFSCLLGYFASWVCVSSARRLVAFVVVDGYGIAWFILVLRLGELSRF